MVDRNTIDQVIASIKGLNPSTAHVGFNMSTYGAPSTHNLVDHSGRDCKFIADIAGHALLAHTDLTIDQIICADSSELEILAAALLGLNTQQANELFFDLPVYLDLDWIPAETAIGVLNHLKEHNEVDWRRIPESECET